MGANISFPYQGVSDIEYHLRNQLPKASTYPFLFDYGVFILIFLAAAGLLTLANHSLAESDKLPVLNRYFVLEPTIFSRMRWTFQSQKILDYGYEKYDNHFYKIARGDVDMLVVPSSFIAELNKLPQDTINSRMCHSYSMVGHLNGMDVVLKTNLHVKTLLNRISPALPVMLWPAAARIEESLKTQFPQDVSSWTTIKPLEAVAHCVSRAMTLASVGEPTCDDPRFISTTLEHNKNVFELMFLMRMVPASLQPFVSWLVPVKWRLRRSTRELERFIIPRVEQLRARQTTTPEPNLLSWMIEDARDSKESDPYMLTQLLAALSAGGTYSVANLIVGVLLDLVDNPKFLAEMREEIQVKHAQVDGVWDHAAFNSLLKLDSAMKETARLSPGSNTTYSRVMLKKHTLSNGVCLERGQFICVNSYCRSKDPKIFHDPEKYDALRAYNDDLEEHTARPFKVVHGEDFRWGSGRWACAGRYIAALVAKVILVRLLDEYEFEFSGSDKRPTNMTLHEFVFVNPSVKLRARRREYNSGIAY